MQALTDKDWEKHRCFSVTSNPNNVYWPNTTDRKAEYNSSWMVYLKSEAHPVLLQVKLKIKAKIGYNKLNALMILILTLWINKSLWCHLTYLTR